MGDNQCHVGWKPAEEYCNKDTGGRCRIWSGAGSRDETHCTGAGWESGTGHQCQCNEGYCATKAGTCRRQIGGCNKDTGGTCRFFGCGYSRHAKCVNHKCVCEGWGVCPENGMCVRTMEEESLASNETLQAESFSVDAGIQREEDWEVAVNVATGMVVIGAPMALIFAAVLAYRQFMNRKVSGDVNEKLLKTEE